MLLKSFVSSCIAAVVIGAPLLPSTQHRFTQVSADTEPAHFSEDVHQTSSHKVTLVQTQSTTISRDQTPAQSPATVFAQTKIENPSCDAAILRAKKELPDFHSLVSSSTQWADTDFTPDASSLYWSNHGEWLNYSEIITWKRASEELSDHTLFGANGVDVNDI